MFAFDHVAISVLYLEKSISFYSVFGFSVIKKYMAKDESCNIVLLSNSENKYIEIFYYKNNVNAPEYTASKDTDLPVIGTKHMAFRVENINKAAELIESKKIARNICINEGRLGKRYFFIKDPNGILVEVIEENFMHK